MRRAIGLAAAAASTSGAMMLAPDAANAATAQSAHLQTASNVSKASGGGYGRHYRIFRHHRYWDGRGHGYDGYFWN